MTFPPIPGLLTSLKNLTASFEILTTGQKFNSKTHRAKSSEVLSIAPLGPPPALL